MFKDPPELNLPHSWTCWLELKQSGEGAFFGKAELRQGGNTKCVFVIAQQPSSEMALARLKIRTDHFIQEWETRVASEVKSEVRK